ncbi:hypothetical protein [Sphingomonas profundi]|uniref:hypothetical protein n=1 Tax=Alterirhizorhabdus profundi TaxID=2681549 RepID=UPI0012E8D5B7|nr:hypothetical protein [Sphingomonas profundi]
MQWQAPSLPRDGSPAITARPVLAPPDHQGVGNALRSAYLPRVSDMPRDLADLLDKLD